MKSELLDLLFPKHCLSCNSFGSYICSSCIKEIISLDAQICPECNRQAIGGRTHPGCRRRYTLDGLSVPFRYQGVIRQALRQFKYKPWLTNLRTTLVSLSLKALGQNRAFQGFIANKPAIVPVPIHWLRKIARGYNQTEILSKTLKDKLNFPSLHGVLFRKRYTRPQYGLNRDKREKNVGKAFALRIPIQVDAILLFDDVWTTGATMRACANVLKRAGVEKVWGLTIAR